MIKKGKQKEVNTTHIKSIDFYKFFASNFFMTTKKGRNYFNKEHDYYVDPTTFNKIVGEFNKELMDLALYKSLDIKLPARMGTICIRKKKIVPYIDKNGRFVNTLPPDWKATMELWKTDPVAKEKKTLIRHLNEHTKGFIVSWKFDKSTATFKWKSAYDLIFCRTAKVALAQVLKDEESTLDYYEE